MQSQSQVQYEFAAEPQLSHPKYRDQDFYEDLTDLPDDESKIKPDYFIDRPPTPEYKPMPKGIDVSTQIESYEPELFDYILEVEPVLQVLVGKSVEQARMELIEESEREAHKIEKQQFEKRRNAELMVTQRMEAAYVRRKEERERRILQHKLHQEQMKLSQQKFIARVLSKQALRGVQTRILDDLHNLGYLRNDHLLELQVHTLPWLIDKIQHKLVRNQLIHNQMIDLLDQVQIPVQNTHQNHYQQEMNRRKVILDERERLRKEVEQRKIRKAEIKRRRAIKEKREIQRSGLYNTTLSKAESSNNIFQVSIHEGMVETGQKGVVLPYDLTLLISQLLDLITGDQLDQIDDQIIQTIWMDILMNKCNQLTVNVNIQLQSLIQEGLQKIEEDLLIFEKQYKNQLIAKLTNIWSQYASQKKSETIRPIILNKMLQGLFEIYFKSVNYKEPKLKTETKIKTEENPPEIQNQPENPTDIPEQQQQQQQQQQYQQQQQQQQQVEEEPQIDERPEITPHDLEMVEAKKKINLVFRQPQLQFDQVSAIVNLFVPYFEPEPTHNDSPQAPNTARASEGAPQKEQEQEQIQEIPVQVEEPAKPPGKWDFDPKTIDIYDGEQPLIQEGQRSEVDCLYQYTFQENVIVNDQRAIEFARLQIYNYLKEKLESFMNIPEFSSLEFTDKPFQQPNLPIYDYEL